METIDRLTVEMAKVRRLCASERRKKDELAELFSKTAAQRKFEAQELERKNGARKLH